MSGVWCDTRIGGCPKWWLDGPQKLMRIPDELRDCVCFVQCGWEDSPDVSLGTAFFIGVRLGLAEAVVEDRIATYAVTARHVIKDSEGLAEEIALVINTKPAGARGFRTNPEDWILHPTADVAVSPVQIDDEVLDCRIYPTDSFATDALIEEKKIGPGEDAFVTGLLVHHPGATRIMPVVRMGSIAALPEDSVELRTGKDVVGLLEVRSIGGLSGSPVFVHLPFWRDAPEGAVLMGGGATASSGGTHYLLGVMHGFYPVGVNDPDGVSGGDENLNTGIAVVALAERIMDLLNSPDQKEKREMAKKKFEESRRPRPTSKPAKDRPEFDEFEELTGKVLSVPKEELEKERAKEKKRK